MLAAGERVYMLPSKLLADVRSDGKVTDAEALKLAETADAYGHGLIHVSNERVDMYEMNAVRQIKTILTEKNISHDCRLGENPYVRNGISGMQVLGLMYILGGGALAVAGGVAFAPAAPAVAIATYLIGGGFSVGGGTMLYFSPNPENQ